MIDERTIIAWATALRSACAFNGIDTPAAAGILARAIEELYRSGPPAAALAVVRGAARQRLDSMEDLSDAEAAALMPPEGADPGLALYRLAGLLTAPEAQVWAAARLALAGKAAR